MKDQRPGGTSAVGGGDAATRTAPATPGKTTLVGDAEAAGNAAPASPGKATRVGGQPIEVGGGPTVEGGTLFSGPDASISTTVPPEGKAPAASKAATPTPEVSNEDYESRMNIKAAIDSGKMQPIAGVNGQSFAATGIAGHADGKITFKFERAFVGDYEYAAAGKTVRGVHVIITATLSNCGEHTDVKLIQVLRSFSKQGGANVTADPNDATRRARSGWDDPRAASRGWRVDMLTDKTTPFYPENSSDDFHGQNGSSTKPLRLRDTPGDWSTATNIGKEFRTCAVSYAGGKGTVLACIEWGYYIDEHGAATFYPASPVAIAGSVAEVKDAAARFDAMSSTTTKANLQ